MNIGREYYAVPGTYRVETCGNAEVIGLGEVTVEPGETTRIQLGRVTVRNPLQAKVAITLSWSNGERRLTLKPGEEAKLYAAPGEYDVVYRLGGLPASIAGSTIGDVEGYLEENPVRGTVGIGAGETKTLEPPGLEKFLSRLGGLVVRSDWRWGVLVNVSWRGGGKEVVVEPGGEARLYAVPGSYRVLYQLEAPRDGVLLDPGMARGTVEVSLGAGDTKTLELPPSGKVLGKLVVRAPPGTKLVVEWLGGKKELVVGSNGSLALYASPGSYAVSAVFPGGSSVSRSLSLGPGSVEALELSPPVTSTRSNTAPLSTRTSLTETRPAVTPTVTGTARTTTSSPVTRPVVNTSVAGAVASNHTVTSKPSNTSTGPPIGVTASPTSPSSSAMGSPSRGSPGAGLLGQPYTLALALGGGVLGAAVVALRRRGGAAEPVAPRSIAPSLSGIGELLSKPLSVPEGKPSCRGGVFEARLPRGVAPEGYEGSWSCCLLGCGGWGCAYRCEGRDRVVVFKVPRGFEEIIRGGSVPTISPGVMEKIAERASALQGLRHPHLLRLLGYSTRAPLLVYEYADGGSLEEVLAKGWRPSVEDALLLGVQLGDALRYIHSRGLVHGDVKPGNIFLVNRVAKLGDFSSLVRLLTVTSSMSRMSYTPGWRAPEQAYSDLRRRAVRLGLENRIDVYQLGNLILYLLAGESVDGEDAANEEAVESVLAKISDKELRQLLREMLALEPEKRPSIEEAEKQLLAILSKHRGGADNG